MPDPQHGPDGKRDWAKLLPFGKAYRACSPQEQKLLGRFFVEELAPHLERVGHALGWFRQMEPEVAIQDLGVIFLENWWRFQLNDNQDLTGYWRIALYRLNVSDWRKRKRQIQSTGELFPQDDPPDDDQSEPVHTALQVELIEHVREALNKLNPMDRELLELTILEGMSSQEIAEMMNLEPGTVRKRCERARNRFREAYQSVAQKEGKP